MNTTINIGITVSDFGVTLWVPIDRNIFDEVGAQEYCGEYEGDNCWAKAVTGDRVMVVFITHEPPEERT